MTLKARSAIRAGRVNRKQERINAMSNQIIINEKKDAFLNELTNHFSSRMALIDNDSSMHEFMNAFLIVADVGDPLSRSYAHELIDSANAAEKFSDAISSEIVRGELTSLEITFDLLRYYTITVMIFTNVEEVDGIYLSFTYVGESLSWDLSYWNQENSISESKWCQALLAIQGAASQHS